MIILSLIFILYNILLIKNLIDNSELNIKDISTDLVFSLLISVMAYMLVVMFRNTFNINKYILILLFSIYLISFIGLMILVLGLYKTKKEIFLHYLSYFIFVNLIFKDNYIHSNKLDFDTRIDDIKITNPKALEYLAVINKKLIPAYLNINEMIKKLNYTPDYDETIKKLFNSKDSIKIKIDDNIDKIINIINKKELNEISNKLHEINKTIDSL